MLHHLTGTIIAIEQSIITIDVAGIGFDLTVPHPESYTRLQKSHVITYFYWNQETGPQLFGFMSETERHVFTLILSCSGIGPKIAISILCQLSPQQFLTAIALADTKQLSSLKGIGLKKAESMVLQLQDKAKKLSNTCPALVGDDTTLLHVKNITEVLQSLSYSRQEIAHTIDHLKQQELFAHSKFDELVRKSLTFLAKTKSG